MFVSGVRNNQLEIKSLHTIIKQKILYYHLEYYTINIIFNPSNEYDDVVRVEYHDIYHYSCNSASFTQSISNHRNNFIYLSYVMVSSSTSDCGI
jgi:hypothetical protein